MELTVRKQFNGFVSVRDYLVKKCLKDQEDLTIWYNMEKRVFTPKQLSRAIQLHTTEFKSKFGTKPYKLVDFQWRDEQNREKIRQDSISNRKEEGQQKRLF